MNALNWKTSLIGVVGAVLYAVWPMIENGVVDYKAILLAATLAAIGYFSKDKDVTGVGVDAVRPVQP